MATKHKEGYSAECDPPHDVRKWKNGQVWACDCGNLFKVTMTNSFGEPFVLWSQINETEVKP